MRVIFLLSFLLVFNRVVIAQGEWLWQNPVPTSSELHSVFFVDSVTGWAAGANGTIIYTQDGGDTWDMQQPADATWISKVFFTDAVTGWAIGSRLTGEYGWGYPVSEGIILKTDDGGSHWIIQPNHGQQFSGYGEFGDIFFANNNIGWLTGGVLSDGTSSRMLKTTDGGNTWYPQGDSTGQIGCLFFHDSLTGWGYRSLSYYQTEIMRTTDGGENWVGCAVDVNGALGSVFFVDENTGWAVGSDNYIYKTINGGADWFRQSIDANISNCQLTSVCFTDTLTGFIAGDGIFLSTKDGGKKWTVEQYQSGPGPLAICFAEHDIGWRVGNQGKIDKTTDSGATWKSQSRKFTSEDLLTIDFVDQYSGWALGPMFIYHTGDGGINWQKQNPSVLFPGLTHLCFVNSLSGWAVGCEYVDGDRAVIFHTSDGGSNWERQLKDKRAPLNEVFFIDQDTGWAVGESGTILFTEDGGVNWMQQESGVSEPLNCVDFINSNCGWITGFGGSVLVTQNGGEEWVIQDTLPPFSGIDFIDSLNGWGVGGYTWPDAKNTYDGHDILGVWGYVYHTADGGKNWELQHDSRTVYNSVKFINESVGWVSGGQILYTSDGGKNWIKQNVPISWISSIDFVDLNHGWMVGGYGSILNTSDGGVTFIKETVKRHSEIPMNIILLQNYPNPFNPSTTIEFSLPKPEFVTLTIFNILGQQVTSLVSEKLNPGIHKYQWQAENLPSGIYYCRLHTGEYEQVRKMVLLR